MTEKILLISTITCPPCGFKKEETMPIDSCPLFNDFTNCGEILKPKIGDCCVFCSFDSVKCPPVKETGKDEC